MTARSSCSRAVRLDLHSSNALLDEAITTHMEDDARTTLDSPPELSAGGPLLSSGDTTPVLPNYAKLTESLLGATSGQLHCSVLCGGRRCKYESGRVWTTQQMAVDGIYSHWVTDELLAMARPNTEVIQQKDVIGQFHRLGITSVLNLQIPGEHASCAKLEDSGFSYDPNVFMADNIFFYNFGWKDFGEPALGTLLDIVKVLAFAVSEGKVAVHCHAGVGRTGVIMACYLVYSLRVKANDAIRYVRLKRQNAVQTRGQILSVQEFEQFILPQMVVFSNRRLLKERDRKSDHAEFSLSQCLNRQRHVLHGYESRVLRHIPKIVYVVCERIAELCESAAPGSSSRSAFNTVQDYRVGSPSFTAFFIAARVQSVTSSTLSYSQLSTIPVSSPARSPTSRDGAESSSESRLSSALDDSSLDSVLGDGIHNQYLSQNDVYNEIKSTHDLRHAASQHQPERIPATGIYDALLADHALSSTNARRRLREYRFQLNVRQSSWEKIATETDVYLLSGLLFEWLEHLKVPVLDTESLTYIVMAPTKIDFCFKKLDKDTRFTLEYLVRFVSRLQPLGCDHQRHLLRRLQAALTHQAVPIEGVLKPAGKDYSKLREGTLNCLNEFMETLLQLVQMDVPRCTTRTLYSPSTQQQAGTGSYQSASAETVPRSTGSNIPTAAGSRNVAGGDKSSS